VLKNSIKTFCVLTLTSLYGFKQQENKADGVVKSPIYCVAAIFQKLGILLVLPPS